MGGILAMPSVSSGGHAGANPSTSRFELRTNNDQGKIMSALLWTSCLVILSLLAIEGASAASLQGRPRRGRRQQNGAGCGRIHRVQGTDFAGRTAVQLHQQPNRYGLGPFYELHVWAWRANSRGAFADMIPDVTCERAH